MRIDIRPGTGRRLPDGHTSFTSLYSLATSAALQVIDTQLVNPDFDIEYLCQEMGMSRSSLYQKIKHISQQSIGDFIRTIRLKRAVQIMTHEDVSLSEVMYRIGIQTQSYFTKAFKKEFGKTPTQFMQDMRK
jgi:AraC-like DNA-binding protein